ncbi:hypothetical protein [[Mycoplasma] anseris]|uniref:Uncharacterized protein n=1 Tax=[Mycoplasma] anseris TaxID=92400 RepID=A0A2Z4NDT3_9BACT|nr:hypothetical protein [[Mycoplasma] anseris]AWX69565.1 hypothetical protein DP065_02255 [[Mycoplasma] anseris]
MSKSSKLKGILTFLTGAAIASTAATIYYLLNEVYMNEDERYKRDLVNQIRKKVEQANSILNNYQYVQYIPKHVLQNLKEVKDYVKDASWEERQILLEKKLHDITKAVNEAKLHYNLNSPDGNIDELREEINKKIQMAKKSAEGMINPAKQYMLDEISKAEAILRNPNATKAEIVTGIFEMENASNSLPLFDKRLKELKNNEALNTKQKEALWNEMVSSYNTDTNNFDVQKANDILNKSLFLNQEMKELRAELAFTKDKNYTFANDEIKTKLDNLINEVSTDFIDSDSNTGLNKDAVETLEAILKLKNAKQELNGIANLKKLEEQILNLPTLSEHVKKTLVSQLGQTENLAEAVKFVEKAIHLDDHARILNETISLAKDMTKTGLYEKASYGDKYKLTAAIEYAETYKDNFDKLLLVHFEDANFELDIREERLQTAIDVIDPNSLASEKNRSRLLLEKIEKKLKEYEAAKYDGPEKDDLRNQADILRASLDKDKDQITKEEMKKIKETAEGSLNSFDAYCSERDKKQAELEKLITESLKVKNEMDPSLVAEIEEFQNAITKADDNRLTNKDQLVQEIADLLAAKEKAEKAQAIFAEQERQKRVQALQEEAKKILENAIKERDAATHKSDEKSVLENDIEELQKLIDANPKDITENDVKTASKKTASHTDDLATFEENARARDALNDLLQKVATFKYSTEEKDYDRAAKEEMNKLVSAEAVAKALRDNKYAKTADLIEKTNELKQILSNSIYADKLFDAKQVLAEIDKKIEETKEEKFDSNSKNDLKAKREELNNLINSPIDLTNEIAVAERNIALKEKSDLALDEIKKMDNFITERAEKEKTLNTKISDAEALIKKLQTVPSTETIAAQNKLQELLNTVNADNQKTAAELDDYISKLNAEYASAEQVYLKKLADDDVAARAVAERKIQEADQKLADTSDPKYAGAERNAVEEAKQKLNEILALTDPKATTQQIIDATTNLNQKITDLNDYKNSYNQKQATIVEEVAKAKKFLEKMKALTPDDSEAFKTQKQAYEELIANVEAESATPTIEALDKVLNKLKAGNTTAKENYDNRYNELLNIAKAKADESIGSTLLFKSKFEDSKYDGPIKDKLNEADAALKVAKAGQDLDKIRDLTEKLNQAREAAELHKAKVDAQGKIDANEAFINSIADAKYNSDEKDTLNQAKTALASTIASATTVEQINEAKKTFEDAIEAMKIKKAQVEGQETWNAGNTKLTQYANNEFNSPQKDELKAALDNLQAKVLGNNIAEIEAAQRRVERAMADMDKQNQKHQGKKDALQELIDRATQFKDQMSNINTDKKDFLAKINEAQAKLESNESTDEILENALNKLNTELSLAQTVDQRDKSIEKAQQAAAADSTALEEAIANVTDEKYAGKELEDAKKAKQELDALIAKTEDIDKNSIIPEIDAARKKAQAAADALNNFKAKYDQKNQELHDLITNVEQTIANMGDKPEYAEEKAKLEQELANAKTKLDKPNVQNIINEINVLNKANEDAKAKMQDHEDMINSPEYQQSREKASQVLEEAKQLLAAEWVTGTLYDSEEKTKFKDDLTKKKEEIEKVLANPKATTNDLKNADIAGSNAIDKLKAYKAYKETEALITKYDVYSKLSNTNAQYLGTVQLDGMKGEITKATVLTQDKNKKYAEIELIRQSLLNKCTAFDSFVQNDYTTTLNQANSLKDSLSTPDVERVKNELATEITDNSISGDVNTIDTAELMNKALALQNAIKTANVKKEAAQVYNAGKQVQTDFQADEYNSTEKTKLADALTDLQNKLNTKDFNAINIAKEKVSSAMSQMNIFASAHDKLKRDFQTEIDEATIFYNGMSEINTDKSDFLAKLNEAKGKVNTTSANIEAARVALRNALRVAREEDVKNKSIEEKQRQALLAYGNPADQWFNENMSDAKYDGSDKTALHDAITALNNLATQNKNIDKDTFDATLKTAIDKLDSKKESNLLKKAQTYKTTYDTHNNDLKAKINEADEILTNMKDLKTVSQISFPAEFNTKLSELEAEITNAKGMIDKKETNNNLVDEKVNLENKFTGANTQFTNVFKNYYETQLLNKVNENITYANNIAYSKMKGPDYNGTEKDNIRNEVALLIGTNLALKSNIQKEKYDVSVLKELISKTETTKTKADIADGYRAQVDAKQPIKNAQSLFDKMTDQIYDSDEKTKLNNYLTEINKLMLKPTGDVNTTKGIDDYRDKLLAIMEPANVTYTLMHAVQRFQTDINTIKNSTEYRRTNQFNIEYANEMQKFYDYIFEPSKVRKMRSVANDATKNAFQRRVAKEMINLVLFTDQNFHTWGAKSVDNTTPKDELKEAVFHLDDYLSRFYYVISVPEEWMTQEYWDTARIRNFIGGDKDYGIGENDKYKSATESPNGFRINRLQDSRFSSQWGYQRYVLSLDYDTRSAEGLYKLGWNGNMKVHNGGTLRSQSAKDMMKIWVNEGYIKIMTNIYDLFNIVVDYINLPGNAEKPEVIKLEKDIDAVIKATGKPFVSLPIASVLLNFITNNNIKSSADLFNGRKTYTKININNIN